MKTEKIKNFHQKKLAIAGTIVIIAFGMIFILVTVRGVENNIAYNYLNAPPQINLESGNNPLMRIDQDGRGWYTYEDKKYAKQIIEEVENRIENLEIENLKLPKNDKAKENNQHQINDLEWGIHEIQYLGSNKDYKITYKKVDRTHDHYKVIIEKKDKSLLLKLQYSDIATALHESRHVYQYIKEGSRKGIMFFKKKILSYKDSAYYYHYEIKTYRLQYSFLNSSFPKISAYSDINEAWLKNRKKGD